MLVNLATLLEKAKIERKAIPAFNVYNLETIAAALEAAEKLRSPVIIAFGEGYMPYAPIRVIAAIVKEMAASTDLPVVLHLDHAKQIKSIAQAIQCGFTSIMYDGSELPLTENIRNTKTIVDFAHAAGVSVEGELGYMNPEDGSSDPTLDLKKGYTDPKAAAEYVTATGIDALAIAIGNAHGIYKGVPELNFTALEQIERETRIPLVLHGSSGIPDELIKKAVGMGVCKINVNTEVSVSAVQATRDFLSRNPAGDLRFDKMLTPARLEMRNVIERYIQLLTD